MEPIEITDEQKQIIKAIGVKDITTTQIQKKLPSTINVGAELPLLVQMGIVEECDGYYYLEDDGIALIGMEGNEVPEHIMRRIMVKKQQTNQVKIDEPGTAREKYLKGKGIIPSKSQKAYEQGVQRQREKTQESTKVISTQTQSERFEVDEVATQTNQVQSDVDPVHGRDTQVDTAHDTSERIDGEDSTITGTATKEKTLPIACIVQCPVNNTAVPLKFCATCCQFYGGHNIPDFAGSVNCRYSDDILHD